MSQHLCDDSCLRVSFIHHRSETVFTARCMLAEDSDPLPRLMAILQQMEDAFRVLGVYEPSGLDEFHPDTTHNPDPSSAPSPGTGAA